MQIGVAQFQRVAAQTAQAVGFVEEGGEAALFGEGREGNTEIANYILAYIWLCPTSSFFDQCLTLFEKVVKKEVAIYILTGKDSTNSLIRSRIYF